MSTLKENIYLTILNRIVELEYLPGDLLSEKALAEEFGVSRTPIREIIVKLSEKGFVKLMPNVGTMVSEVDINEVINIFEIKKPLQVLACELAAMRASKEQIREIKEIVKCIMNDQAEYERKDCVVFEWRLLNIIADSSKNAYISYYLKDLNAKVMRYANYVQLGEYLSDSMKDSLVVLSKAISLRDSQRAGLAMGKYTQMYMEQFSKSVLSRSMWRGAH